MTTSAEDLMTALVSSGRLSKMRRLTYRCRTGHCTLLEIVDADPVGIVVRRPGYRYSDTENKARSSADGRRVNTSDGDRRWKANTFYIGQSALGEGWRNQENAHLDLSCDHLLAHQLTADEFWSAWDAGHSEIYVRTDNTRYAV